jgi:CRISPR-associated endonuclease/helicase Cas3
MATGFTEFVRAVHGHDPFPWQRRAADALCAGEPPEAICVPTGTGKTSILDAAVFAMGRGSAWRRVIYTVDRRLVVDGVSEHAQRIAEAIGRADHPAVKPVAEALGGRLRVVRLRGGVPLDDEWVLHPEDPCILVTTVDQAGSRLLFRGYGVSPRQAPIHAALLGHGALHVLDEAHLSHAYLSTLQACRSHGAAIGVIEMTATPAAGAARVLALDEADRADPVLALRLQARKPARLVSTPAGKLAGTLEKEAVAMRKAGARVVGVVVNTVGRAREVFEALRGRGDAVLLTGRVRPFERDRLVEALLPRIRAGRDRSGGEPLFVVATQAVEVGADLDFDALVTECASLPALRQRFGRLDRLGAAGNSEAVIVFASKTDKVYGPSYDAAWAWMQAVAAGGALDFGIEAFAGYPAPPAEPGLPVPPLARSHVDLLTITGTAAPQIDIAPWLHGIERPGGEVSIVWRADLDPDRPQDWAEIVALVPPMSAEALAVPIHAARAWLQAQDAPEIADVAVAAADGTRGAPGRQALRWDGEQGVPVVARALRPGDTLVVPARYGGCDAMGWNPGHTDPVRDFAEAVRDAAGRPKRARIHPALEPDKDLLEAACLWADLVRTAPDVAEADVDDFEQRLAEAEERLIERLAPGGPVALDPYPAGEGAIARRIGPEFGQVLETGVAIPLAEHLQGVGQWARRLAEALGADADLLEDAGRLHDEGKRVEAFQTMLHGSPIHPQPLAKSGLTGSAARASWLRSGLPRGFRHEAASVALAGRGEALLRHLVGAHHGHARPWFPVCDDPALPGSDLARLESGWLQQFAALRSEHGPWRLAWLEMILRVADARRSIEEQAR